MSITTKTRKMLWGRAGARCSFDGCQIELIRLSEAGTEDAVLVEEAHIIAQRKDGPRGEIPIELLKLYLKRCGLNLNAKNFFQGKSFQLIKR